ncbi:sensor histidine kinase [Rubrimonas sp.]|uniref:sensor histidine kinase n=1 Tax=Rubrimonas sp. TaxID=2036015 RepID=UPI002FDCFFC8
MDAAAPAGPQTLEDAREALFRLERRAAMLQGRVERLESLDTALRAALSADLGAQSDNALFLNLIEPARAMLRFDHALALKADEFSRLRVEASTAPALLGVALHPGKVAGKALGGRALAVEAGRLLDFAAPGAPHLFGPDAPALAAPFTQGGAPGLALFLRDEDAPGFDRADIEIAAQLALLAAQTLTLQSAARAASARGRLLCAMSHELRTPLNGMIGMAALLDRDALTDRQREGVRVIRAEAAGLLGSIERILDYVQLESGDAALDRAPFGLLAVAREIAARHAPAAHAKGLTLTLSYDPFLPYRVLGDAARLRAAIDGLVENAIRFAPAGDVRLSVEGADSEGRIWAQIAVTDEGPGVAEEDREAIFEPFEQGRAAMGLRKGGVGMGLAMARLVARQCGGGLGLSQGPDGRGACFTFAAPFEIDAEADAPPGPQALAGLGVGVICPGPGARLALASRLKAWGARAAVWSAPPPLSALRDACGDRVVALAAPAHAARAQAQWRREAVAAQIAPPAVLILDPLAKLIEQGGGGALSPFEGRRAFVGALRAALPEAPAADARAPAARG